MEPMVITFRTRDSSGNPHHAIDVTDATGTRTSPTGFTAGLIAA